MVVSVGKEWTFDFEDGEDEITKDFTYHPQGFYIYAFGMIDSGSGTATVQFQGGWGDYWDTLFEADVSDTDDVVYLSATENQSQEELSYLEGEQVPLIWPKHRFRVTRDSSDDSLTLKIFTREKYP